MELHKPTFDSYGYVSGRSATYTKLAAMFRSAIPKGMNAVTPTFLGYVEIPNGVAEISQGPKFIDLDMYGITVVIDGKYSDKSTCLHSYEDVKKYIEDLNKELA
jgi:hypothetical protein